MKETFLDVFLRKARIKRLLPYIFQYRDCKLLDIGCGWEGRFLNSISPYIKEGIGVDKKAPLLSDKPNISFMRADLNKELNFLDCKFNIITMMAVLEHLNNTEIILQEIKRLLSPGGLLIGTVPSLYAKPVLEFLAFKLKVIDKNEILDHKDYYNKELLKNIFLKNGLKLTHHKYFQFGMNNFFIAKVSSNP